MLGSTGTFNMVRDWSFESLGREAGNPGLRNRVLHTFSTYGSQKPSQFTLYFLTPSAQALAFYVVLFATCAPNLVLYVVFWQPGY